MPAPAGDSQYGDWRIHYIKRTVSARGGRRTLVRARPSSTQPLPPTGQETGIDLGLEAFATLSDGAMIHNPRCYRKAERALKTAQRRVSRRKKGSNRRRKAVKLLAKAQLKVKRQRADFHHKVALRLVQSNDTINHEDLQTANLVKNHHLATSISDAGW
jgi:putative transposase